VLKSFQTQNSLPQKNNLSMTFEPLSLCNFEPFLVSVPQCLSASAAKPLNLRAFATLTLFYLSTSESQSLSTFNKEPLMKYYSFIIVRNSNFFFYKTLTDIQNNKSSNSSRCHNSNHWNNRAFYKNTNCKRSDCT
jgi:hypothetical protein